jgi:hypothetical protein
MSSAFQQQLVIKQKRAGGGAAPAFKNIPWRRVIKAQGAAYHG